MKYNLRQEIGRENDDKSNMYTRKVQTEIGMYTVDLLFARSRLVEVFR